MTSEEIIKQYREGVRDFRGANLRGADLYGADLCRADLRGADLRGANLYGANLRGANLYGADLRGANLYGANLCRADLRGANLRGADLRGANLRGADLRGADLRGANLRGANLRGADLRGANLYGAKYGITQTLLASWGGLTDALTLECMRWDATLLPDPAAMDRWADSDGEEARCPCPGKDGTERMILFTEDAKLWQPGPPTMTLRQLWEAIAAEKDVKI